MACLVSPIPVVRIIALQFHNREEKQEVNHTVFVGRCPQKL